MPSTGAPLPMENGRCSEKRTEIFLAEPLHCAAFVSREQDGSAYLAARIAAFVSAHGAIRLCADCVGRLPKRSLATRRVTEPGWCESCGSHGAEAFRLPLTDVNTVV